MYPDRLDDVNNFSPELIIAWAQKQVIMLEIESIEEQLEFDEEIENNDYETDLKMPEEEREETKKMLEDHKFALEQAEIVFEGILKGLKLKNYFAENIKDHLEVSQ